MTTNAMRMLLQKNLKFYRGWAIFLRLSSPPQKQGSGPDDPPAPKRDARAHIDDERPRASRAAVVRGKWVSSFAS